MDLLHGIDTVAHKNSLGNPGKTIAVIASGFNYIFPKENICLIHEIIENGGCIVSEYSPNTKVDMKKFPMRNRIIAGISEATIVIEAKARSGSEITARNAMEQGKEVFCIPQDIGKKTGVGTNTLIKKGAKLITCTNDILLQLGKPLIKNISDKYKSFDDFLENKQRFLSVQYGSKCFNDNIETNVLNNFNFETNFIDSNISKIINIDKKYETIYKYICNNTSNIDKLSRDLNISIAELNQTLTMMEIEGLIKIFPGNIIKAQI